jgi:hypothetical protein
VFVTLSLYRHSDCHGAALLGTTMKLYDTLRKDGVHFLQCFHYALVHTSHGSWHSCFSLGAAGPYEGTSSKNKNLKHGIAIAAYGQMNMKEKNALKGYSSTAMFDRLATGFQDIVVNNPEAILDPQYAKYYENPELARK